MSVNESINMKKEVALRLSVSVPGGIAIGFVVPLIISIIRGSGDYIPCTPALVELAGSEINAVIIQMVCSAFIGVASGVGSLIYEIENWSLFRQTATYFLLNGAAINITALTCRWMDFSILSTIVFLIQYAVIFFIIWFIIYAVNYHNIKKMNSKIK